MGYDKVIDSAQLDADLQSVADKIRAKSGITGTLEFPEGFCSAVDAIQVGGVDNTVLDGLIDRSITSVVNTTVESIGQNAFRNCSKLVAAEFSALTTISGNAFTSCSTLVTLILRSSNTVTLGGTNAFTSTPIASGTGYIYVPSALVNSYRSATNWSAYADQIRAIEDYPEITGG